MRIAIYEPNTDENLPENERKCKKAGKDATAVTPTSNITKDADT